MTGSTSYAREQIEGHPIRKGDSHKHPRATRCPLRAGYGLAAGLVGLFLFASGVPSALYGTYQQLWGFSPLVLTLVYATYAFGVLTMLVLAALTGLMAATVLPAIAGGIVAGFAGVRPAFVIFGGAAAAVALVVALLAAHSRPRTVRSQKVVALTSASDKESVA